MSRFCRDSGSYDLAEFPADRLGNLHPLAEDIGSGTDVFVHIKD